MTRGLFASLAAAVMVVLLLVVPADGGATTRLGLSPHGKADGCAACHDPATGGAKVGPARPALATCRSCHPDADMHPVDITPVNIKIADGWPLENGKVTCATCHAEPACDANRTKVSPWFRGGEPERKMDFCYRCHVPTGMKRSNPHVATTSGEKTSCAACHTGEPTKGAAVAQSRLRLKPAEACSTCHPGTIHAGAAEHMGKVVKATLAPADAAALPLGEGGAIECWTCHDVHQAGGEGTPSTHGISGRIVAARNAPAAAPAPTPARPKLLALPAADGSLCRACHGKGP